MGEGRRWARPSSSFISSSSLRLRHRFIPFPSSSHLLSRPVVARLVVSSVIRSVCRFHLLVAIRFVVVPPPAVVLSVVVLPHRAPFRLLVARHLVPRPVARFVHHSSARSFSPFLDTMGGAFSHSIARRVSKHEGVAGRGIAMGVAR